MYRYRIKIPTFLLGCLLLVAAINVVGTTRMRNKLNSFVVPPSNLLSAQLFDAKLAATTDPAELRTLASQQHRIALAADHAISTWPGLLKQMNRTLLIQGWGVLGLVILYYLFEYRMPPR